MSAARLRNLIADVQLKELKLAVSRGELILINDAVEFAYKRLNAIYTELTLRRPKRLARRIAKCKTAAEVTKILKADAELIRTGLQKDFPEISIPLENG